MKERAELSRQSAFQSLRRALMSSWPLWPQPLTQQEVDIVRAKLNAEECFREVCDRRNAAE